MSREFLRVDLAAANARADAAEKSYRTLRAEFDAALVKFAEDTVTLTARAEAAEKEVAHLQSSNRYQRGYGDGEKSVRARALKREAKLRTALSEIKRRLGQHKGIDATGPEETFYHIAEKALAAGKEPKT